MIDSPREWLEAAKPNPNSMPWRTYERLRAKGEHREMLAFAGLAAWLERLKERVWG